MIAQWRNNRWLKRYYARLRDVGDDARDGAAARRAAATPSTSSRRCAGRCRRTSRKLPLQQQQDVYHWRLHVSLILNEATERLGRMEAADTG